MTEDDFLGFVNLPLVEAQGVFRSLILKRYIYVNTTYFKITVLKNLQEYAMEHDIREEDGENKTEDMDSGDCAAA